MIGKIYDFLCDYEDVIAGVLWLLIIIGSCCYLLYEAEKRTKIEFNIIENTKDYKIFDNCQKFDNKFYCWNEVEE